MDVRLLPRRIVSGGQTGVDRAALDWAIEHGIAHGGWCPASRLAEDGPIPERYQLTELGSAGYRQRTCQNVLDSDATLILNVGALEGGTAQTVRFAQQVARPHLVLDLGRADAMAAGAEVTRWLEVVRPKTLNIAGPRESKRPGVGALAREMLDRVSRARLPRS